MIDIDCFIGQGDGDPVEQQYNDVRQVDQQVGAVPAYHRGNPQADAGNNINNRRNNEQDSQPEYIFQDISGSTEQSRDRNTPPRGFVDSLPLLFLMCSQGDFGGHISGPANKFQI